MFLLSGPLHLKNHLLNPYATNAQLKADLLFLKKNYLFLIEGYLLYSITFSTKHQHESAIGLPMSLLT